MINTAEIFKNVIPVNVLMEMPNALVRNLRDIRITQLEARRKDTDNAVNGISLPTEALEDVLENEL